MKTQTTININPAQYSFSKTQDKQQMQETAEEGNSPNAGNLANGGVKILKVKKNGNNEVSILQKAKIKLDKDDE